jgi:hypothetical protein
MLINGNLTVKLRFATGEVFPSGPIWNVSLGNKIPVDVVIVARLEVPDRSILDYLVVPALSGLRGRLRLRKSDNPAFIEFYRFSSLAAVIETFRSSPVQEKA